MNYSLYAVRRSSLLCFSRTFLLEAIRENPQLVSVLTEVPLVDPNDIQYSRIAVIPINYVSDYDYFVTVLYSSINTIRPTNLVKIQHLLENVYLSFIYETRMTTMLTSLAINSISHSLLVQIAMRIHSPIYPLIHGIPLLLAKYPIFCYFLCSRI